MLGSRIVPALAAGASSAGVTPVTVPADTSAGVFYIIAQADANGQVTEVERGQQPRAASLKTGPDLQVTVLTRTAEASGAVHHDQGHDQEPG